MSNIARILALALMTGMALPVAAETVAVTNARIHTMGPAGEIGRGTVLIRDGKVAAVGADVAVPAGARVVDAGGGVVTPGLVAADTTLSVAEVNSLHATNDHDGAVEHLSAAFDVKYGINPNSTLIPVARLGGITRAVVTPDIEEDRDERPKERLFAGQAATIHLGPGDDLLMASGVGMVVHLGEAGAGMVGGARGTSFAALKAALDEGRHYALNRARYDYGHTRPYRLSREDLEALIPVVEGRMPLLVHVHRAADIRQVLKLAREDQVKVVLLDAEEGWMVASEIAKARVPVVVNPLSNLPARFETLGATLENAARLHAAGVTIVIEGSRTGHFARQVRYNAGNAVAHGLPWKAALEAITINPARVFGFGARAGSLEAGKEADLVVWDGDPLEPLTQPRHVFVKGTEMPMDSRARQLAKRYRDLNPDQPPAYR